MRFVKPLDEKLLHQIFKKHNKVITVEDGCVQGGFGSAVLEFMADHNYNAQEVKTLREFLTLLYSMEHKTNYGESVISMSKLFRRLSNRWLV